MPSQTLARRSRAKRAVAHRLPMIIELEIFTELLRVFTFLSRYVLVASFFAVLSDIPSSARSGSNPSLSAMNSQSRKILRVFCLGTLQDFTGWICPIFEPCEVDKENPRMEIEIEEVL